MGRTLGIILLIGGTLVALVIWLADADNTAAREY